MPLPLPLTLTLSRTLPLTLQTVKASELEEFVTSVVGPAQVVTVVCVRQDDYKCRKAQMVQTLRAHAIGQVLLDIRVFSRVRTREMHKVMDGYLLGWRW